MAFAKRSIPTSNLNGTTCRQHSGWIQIARFVIMVISIIICVRVNYLVRAVPQALFRLFCEERILMTDG